MNEPKTVRVKVAVAVSASGQWLARGEYYLKLKDGAVPFDIMEAVRVAASKGIVATVYWVEADVPLPLAPAIVRGSVSPAEEG